MSDHLEACPPAEGVYFAPGDYAGLLSRLVVVIVDLGVLLFVAWSTAVGTDRYLPPKSAEQFIFGVWAGASFLYLVLMERSRVGTLGLRLLRLRIVDLHGHPPSVLRMSFRFALLILGPVHLFLDLLWIGGDRDKQMLRDKLAGTYMVKRNALPAGRGAVRWVHYTLMGYALIFPEVERPR